MAETVEFDSRVAARIGCVIVLLVAACQGEAPIPRPTTPVAMPPATSPNIVLILVDDLGFADLGVTGSEIRTPNIDALARAGVFFTDFHATPVCFATRAALLTGVDHHTAGMGALAMARAPNQRGHASYAGALDPAVPTLAERLRERGYHTFMAGKWDLGSDPESGPDRRGFERSWALLDGGASHFDDAAGLVVFQRGAHYRADGRPVEPPPGFYSSRFYTDELLRYLEDRPADGRPFFAYAAYTAPHWPLQVPDDWLQRYQGVYGAGYQVLNRQRLERMQALGLVPRDVVARDLPPHVQPWESLDMGERRHESRRMELYAAMVELLDEQLGHLLDGVRKSAAGRPTVVVFLSDNGPEGNSIDRLPLKRYWLPLAFDNSPDDLGRKGSYAWYGAGWAQASATPSRLYKAFPTEGGYRVPAIISWPGQVVPGRRDNAVLRLTDLTATLLDIAGADTGGAVPLEGHSFQARLLDPAAHGPNEGRAMAFELFGRQAVRQDRWKAVRFAEPFGAGRWELYDLATDPAESRDQAALHPEILAELTTAWERYAREVDVVIPEGGERSYGVP